MKTLLFLLVAVFITACSDSDHTQKVEQDHVWKEQTDMINKAKGVEQMLQDAAELQQQRVNEQTQ